MTTDRPGLLPRLSALGAVCLWGVSFVATKAALRDLSPITLIFTRFALGAVVLVLILKLRRRPVVPPRGALPVLALMGFIGVFVHQMLQVYGLTLTTAIRTGWLIGLTPIWVAVLSALLLGESFSARKMLGLVVGTAGALLVITRGEISWQVFALPATAGDLLILASTVNWAVYTIFGRETLKRLGSARAITAAMFFGWAMLVPFFFTAAGWREYEHLSAGGVAATIFLGVGCSGFGYLLWYAALERVDASRVASFLYIEPLVTLLAAGSLLGETVAGLTALGGVLVLAGVLLVQKG